MALAVGCRARPGKARDTRPVPGGCSNRSLTLKNVPSAGRAKRSALKGVSVKVPMKYSLRIIRTARVAGYAHRNALVKPLK